MKDHYLKFIEKAELPEDAAVYLIDSANKILSVYSNDLEGIINFLYNNSYDVGSTLELRKALSEKSEVHLYTLNFIFLVCASKRMLADFLKNDLSEELFWDTILDLKYKLFECKAVMGVWGNFVENWYNIFYSLDVFKLGRLEFERVKYPEDMPVYKKGDIEVKPGDTVYSVHIPSSGPLTRELREDSYAQAKEFFRAERGNEPVVFICHSWLLFENNRQIFPADMNLVDFMNDWDIIDSKESEKYGDCWRLFGKEFDGEVDNLPQTTRQQKAMAAWLKQGKKTGEGFGVRI